MVQPAEFTIAGAPIQDVTGYPFSYPYGNPTQTTPNYITYGQLGAGVMWQCLSVEYALGDDMSMM